MRWTGGAIAARSAAICSRTAASGTTSEATLLSSSTRVSCDENPVGLPGWMNRSWFIVVITRSVSRPTIV